MSPREALDRAQRLLDAVEADVARFDEFLVWFEAARARVHELGDTYIGPVQEALIALQDDDPEVVTPPVANEDAVWEASGAFHDRTLALLRLVTAELTASLDQAAGQDA